MRKLKVWSMTMLMAMAATAFVACGGGDDDVPSTEMRSEADVLIETVCNMFGLNREDYHEDYWRFLEKNGKTVLANVRKSDNHLFVGVYDNTKKTVLMSNTDIMIRQTVKGTYYEDTYDCTLLHLLYPSVGETENGFVIVVNSQYGYNEAVYRRIPYALFYNGKNTVTRELSDNANVNVQGWYANSCLLRMEDYMGVDLLMCCTDEGKEMFSFNKMDEKYNIWGLNDSEGKVVYPLSYSEFIRFDYTPDAKSFEIYRADVVGQSTKWEVNMTLFEDMPSTTRVTYNVEQGANATWTVTCKAVSAYGTTRDATFTLDVETGECKMI